MLWTQASGIARAIHSIQWSDVQNQEKYDRVKWEIEGMECDWVNATSLVPGRIYQRASTWYLYI
ncbi:unnamed protein product [Cyberlindnera jadinii]|uniref:Uncharacterized protein n=1 Tax=Cyberlindnera jadinii (strain ATCC 18201 / CBS 1600 / BCRC 20928 / JCM 3617 / NBRC 0987 / NRRL Y-1542) TaxID=983966 RepID=A0A0H5C742_CYBJN|nr:unnamed protein product [Cyberlindnera jadinii]